MRFVVEKSVPERGRKIGLSPQDRRLTSLVIGTPEPWYKYMSRML